MLQHSEMLEHLTITHCSHQPEDYNTINTPHDSLKTNMLEVIKFYIT